MVLFNRRKYMRTRRSPQGAPIDIADATITVADSVQYTGSPRTPSVTVVYDGATLVVNQDYFVSYNDNTEVGAATAVITGTGEFTGQVVKTFQIVSAPTGWAFKVEDMVHVGSAMSGGGQGTAMLGVFETYSDTAALLIGKASLMNKEAFGNLITKDSQNKFHVANLNSVLEKVSSGSGDYIHLMLVSDNGKITFWESNRTYTNHVKATCSNGFDLQNLSFDTSNIISTSSLDGYSSLLKASTFADGGSRVFYANNGRRAYSVLLSTPYDFSTFDATSKTYVDITEVPQSDFVAIHSILFNSNGTKVLITASTKIYQFLLTTPYDLMTRTLESEASIDADFHGIAVVNNGTTLFGMTESGYVHEYDLVPS